MKNPRFFALWLLLIGTIEAASSRNPGESLEGLKKDKIKEVPENIKIYEAHRGTTEESRNDERVSKTIGADDPILDQIDQLDSDDSRARRHLFVDPEFKWDKGERLMEAAARTRAQFEREDEAQAERDRVMRELRAILRAREGRERERQRNERGRQVCSFLDLSWSTGSIMCLFFLSIEF